jgi:prepilin-type processing-associated H-X9-DG protein
MDRDDVRDPAHTVLVYAGSGEHVAFDKYGRAAIAFVDGHVEEVTPRQAMLLRWMP